MEFTSILFYVFSLFFVGSSLVMITSRNTAKAALWLILTFFSAASLWLLLEAEFLAITLILIYVGAVMVLFMFVIKMLGYRGINSQSSVHSLPASWYFCVVGCDCADGFGFECWSI
jgi:NADH:ubiquinone oxidoreductase subunit 6 (subunit J)